MVIWPLFMALAVDPSVGISESLAVERARQISDLRYGLRLEIPAKRTEAIRGTAKLSFRLREAGRELVLDFVPGREWVEAVESGGKAVEWRWVNGHIVVKEGVSPLEIRFRAGDGPLNRNEDFLYSLFVPARAHHAIPCFDQPDLKARLRVEIVAPAGWEVLTNAPQGEETPPLSPYLWHFAAGKFRVETALRGGRTLRLFHRETDTKKVERNREAIFDLHGRALQWMEDYTGIAYPFGKLDFMALPSFQFGGMEHAGAISYNAGGLFLEESATQAQRLGRASVISHETAHMWFGDLVTMRWFNDVWLKEVFANFMAAKMVNPSFPELNHELRFFLSHYRAAYNIDRTAGANAIRQPLGNLNEAGTLYGPVIYQKSPVVMQQLETLLGEESFRAGLREYLGKFAFKNATWGDLVAILDQRTPVDLAGWSRAWIDVPGRPRIETRLEVAAGKIARLAFVQTGAQRQRLVVKVDGSGFSKEFAVDCGPGLNVVQGAVGMAAPKMVLPRGYGEFRLDAGTRGYLLKNLADLPEALDRANGWGVLWENYVAGQVSSREMLELALVALPRETDELNVQRVLGDLGSLAWREQGEGERVEAVLRAGMAGAKTRSLRSAYFQAYRGVVMSAEGVAWLERVWSGEEKIADLPLGEADFTSISAGLALREVKGWREIVAKQLKRIENPDRRQQFGFVLPALDSDPAVRAAFFERLRDVKQRGREPWVLEGLSYLHHPLRAEASERFLLPALEMLPEIQKTGDIFFPQRWMSASVGSRRTLSAAEVLRKFLASLPKEYPARLRMTILAAGDELLRVKP
jgi:aminopeptidase N